MQEALNINAIIVLLVCYGVKIYVEITGCGYSGKDLWVSMGQKDAELER